MVNSLDIGKAFDKIQHQSMTKTRNTVGIEEAYLNIIRTIYDKPWRRKWQPTPIPLPGKSHGQRNLVGSNPWGRKESDTTERLHHHHDKPIANIIFFVF